MLLLCSPASCSFWDRALGVSRWLWPHCDQEWPWALDFFHLSAYTSMPDLWSVKTWTQSFRHAGWALTSQATSLALQFVVNLHHKALDSSPKENKSQLWCRLAFSCSSSCGKAGGSFEPRNLMPASSVKRQQILRLMPVFPAPCQEAQAGFRSPGLPVSLSHTHTHCLNVMFW